ncbi:MAG: peptidoglycan glycosyltransferase, partial [Clostridia bacterium]|nr:peptidoglycan glycosyltransferase [Clostridia bacterium]
MRTKMYRRAVICGAVLLAALTGLLIRILFIQTVDYEKYRAKVAGQTTYETSVDAQRGDIFDANGVTLATNVTTYRVFISPRDIKAAQDELIDQSMNYAELIAQKLSEVLDVSYDFVIEQASLERYLDRTIARSVSKEDAENVRALISEYGLSRMIYLEATTTRYYPYGSLACHVLGFTNGTGQGLYGLEAYYQEQLTGTEGKYITATDAKGRSLQSGYSQYVEPQDGYNLCTSLDVYIQSVLEEQLKAAYENSEAQNRAAGIVMDVRDGSIKAIAVYPPYDLNDPRTLDEQSQEKLDLSGLSQESEEYADLYGQILTEMWSDKAITEPYIPGSTFKIITASMGLEEKQVTVDENFWCPGYYTVKGITIHCHETHGHGHLTFAQGIQQSCNPVLMQVGLRVGTDTFYDYFSSFGYLEKTGIDLPGEAEGIFYQKDNFTELNLATSSFGQNFKVTPIEQITAVAAVANGGYLVTPHLVSSMTDGAGNTVWSFDGRVKRQVVSQETCKTIANILEEGVSGNGGAKNAYVLGYRVAAKTGTSEKIGDKEDAYICSCVAFAPADDPQYAILILVDEPTKGNLYGSTVAAPYVSHVLEAILPYLGVEAEYTDSELEKLTTSVPSCIYWSVGQVGAYLDTYGLSYEIIGDGSYVTSQVPEAGSSLERSSGT